MGEFKNPYAVRDNKVIYIDDLSETERGINCNCTCPKCGRPMLAKMGCHRQHHFSHADEVSCQGSYESALHLLAKEVLGEGSKIKLPPVIPEYSDEGGVFVLNDVVIGHSKNSNSITIKPVSIIKEASIGAIRPDVMISYKRKETTRNLIVEILVTHAVDDQKAEEIRKLGVSAIEIDFSRYSDIFLSKNDIKDIIEKEVENKHWIFNEWKESFEDVIRTNFDSVYILKNKEKISNGSDIKNLGFRYSTNSNIVFGCPRKIHFDGLSCYSTFEDCLSCIHFKGFIHKISETREKQIICELEHGDSLPSIRQVRSFVYDCSRKVQVYPWKTMDEYRSDFEKELVGLNSKYCAMVPVDNLKRRSLEKIETRHLSKKLYALLDDWLDEMAIDDLYVQYREKTRKQFLIEHSEFDSFNKFEGIFNSCYRDKWNKQFFFIRKWKREIVEKIIKEISQKVPMEKNEKPDDWLRKSILFAKENRICLFYRVVFDRGGGDCSEYRASIVPFLSSYAWQMSKKRNSCYSS